MRRLCSSLLSLFFVALMPPCMTSILLTGKKRLSDNGIVISNDEISRAAKQAATAAGFDLAGIAPVREEDFPELGVFSQWIEAGHAGEMKYLEKRSEAGHLRRVSVKNAAPWAKSVIVCALNYNGGRPYSTE